MSLRNCAAASAPVAWWTRTERTRRDASHGWRRKPPGVSPVRRCVQGHCIKIGNLAIQDQFHRAVDSETDRPVLLRRTGRRSRRANGNRNSWPRSDLRILKDECRVGDDVRSRQYLPKKFRVRLVTSSPTRVEKSLRLAARRFALLLAAGATHCGLQTPYVAPTRHTGSYRSR